MISFREYISEAFDKPYPYTRLKKNPFGDLTADIKEVNVRVWFTPYNDEKTKWTLEFERKGRIDVTGEGDAFRIFATVLKITKDFIKKYDPEEITFSSVKVDEYGNTVNSGRDKLYKRLVKRFASSAGFKYDIQNLGDEIYFTLEKK